MPPPIVAARSTSRNRATFANMAALTIVWSTYSATYFTPEN
jgi:hypothetical protein